MPDWRKACTVAELQEGEPLGTTIADKPIAVFRLGGECFATSNICTHEFAFLSEGWQEKDIIECPIHQARFRITDGRCMGPPADKDLETFRTKVENGEVYVLVDWTSTDGQSK